MVKDDNSFSKRIDNAANCLIASLFYFKLKSMPERREGEFVGSGHICSLSRNDPLFEDLFEQLSAQVGGKWWAGGERGLGCQQRRVEQREWEAEAGCARLQVFSPAVAAPKIPPAISNCH
jgi:hypothetical protein